MTTNTMSNIHSSLMRFCVDFAESKTDFAFVNFDAHANEETAPPGNLIGYAGLSVSFSGHLINIKVLFGVATENDTNLFLLNKTLGELVELIRPTDRIRVYNSETGVDIGWMIVQDGVTVLPVGGSQAKPLQYVMLELATSVNFQDVQ